ncbi:hypothetical protein STCU_11505 [Strigomonas culicis]|uniref:Uncharacterized protein n=1 Tax=Strigomonas culicis TaxID=28005 RepID=S9TIJ4_9TRYP|nr:hypothetical protein STCU_11505 [Strigomonas culicis]|eukprot:EPY16168.1 hypothetical protein STCU_11505 [Strigomonas culicis]
MDTGAEYQAATLAFLNGLHSVKGLKATLVVRLYNSPYVEDIVDALEALEPSLGYHALPLSGKCTTVPTAVTASTLRERMSIVRTYVAFAVGGRSLGYQRIAAKEPLCTVLLTTKFDTLGRLWDARVRHGAPEQGRSSNRTESVMRFFNLNESAIFFHASEEFDSNENGVNDVSIFLGRWLYRKLYDYRFWFLACIPIGIAAFLLLNLSKTFKR